MRTKFAYFFLSCALGLVLGHSLVPHDHFNLEQAKSEIKADKVLSLADILKSALSHNIGANHLEDFKNGKKLEIDENKQSFQFADLKSQVQTGFIILTPETRFTSSSNKSSSDNVLAYHPLRAPPSQS